MNAGIFTFNIKAELRGFCMTSDLCWWLPVQSVLTEKLLTCGPADDVRDQWLWLVPVHPLGSWTPDNHPAAETFESPDKKVKTDVRQSNWSAVCCRRVETPSGPKTHLLSGNFTKLPPPAAAFTACRSYGNYEFQENRAVESESEWRRFRLFFFVCFYQIIFLFLYFYWFIVNLLLKL